VLNIIKDFPQAIKTIEERQMIMNRIYLFLFSFLLLFFYSGAFISTAGPLDNPTSVDDGSALLGNPGSGRPNKVNLYYNNRAGTGYAFFMNGEPYLLIDSILNMFPNAPEITTQEGSAIGPESGQVTTQSGGAVSVNGSSVSVYYYGNNCYLNILGYCTATGIIPKYSKGGIIFLSTSEAKFTIPTDSNMPINVYVNNITSGNNSDPINNISYIIEAGLTNNTNQNIVLNHLNFIVVGNSGKAYVSVKDMGYTVVFGSNDTPDTLMLDPRQQHVVRLIFDLPDNDSPKNFVIIQGQKVLGKRGCN